MHVTSVLAPHARRTFPVRSGVSCMGRHVCGPIALAKSGRDWQTVDGLVLGWRGEEAARDAGDRLDGDRQTAAGVDDCQVEPAQGAFAAGVLMEWRDRAAQQQRGAALAGRARPELCDRHERLGLARRAVAAV